MAITVGSVEVDVIPNTQGIYQRLRAGLEPPAARAGEDAGRVAGRAFGPAMQSSLGAVGERIGEQIGRQIASRVTSEVRGSLAQGIQQGGAAARASATRQGEEAGGAFGRTFRTRIEAAVRALPDIQIGADTTEAEADIRALREQLATLSRQRVGIDVNAATARQQIDEIERELTRLGARHPDIAVRVNTGAASAELATLRAELDRMDRDDVNIDVNTNTAAANLNLLTTAAIALGPALLPILPIAAAGLGAVAAAAVSAGVGFGVLAAVAAPAVAGIARALQAQKAAQDAVSTSTGQGAQKALQMAGAQQALASAQRNAASQIASARDQVRQAARGVEDAERQLADAQKASRQAQLDLVQARKDAAQQLEDLSSRYADAQLSVRDAELSLAEAQQRRREVEADPKATLLDKQRAALAVEQATQRLREQTVETRRLGEEQATAAKTGVEGTQTVKQAQDRLAKSQETVADRTRGVADAQAAVVKAQENVARVSAQAADSIASAQRGIASASASAASGVSAAATAQAKYQAELDKLSPAARGTFDAFVALRSAFSAWSLSLQPAVMPLFTRALEGIKNSLPGLTPLVLAASTAVSGLQDRISAGFKSPWWQSFKADLAGSMVSAITGLGIAFGNVFKGMAGILQAFMPHMDSISDRMEAITGRFARWGTTLKGSPQFERFLAYSAAMGPVVASTFGDIGRALMDVAHALQPIEGPLLKVLGALFQGVSWIATTFPGAIQLMYGMFIASRLWAGGILLVNGALWLASAAMTVFNLVTKAGPWGWIILAIVAVVAAVVLMYRKFDWFRAFIDGVWSGLVAGFQFLGQAATWLWENAIKPAFDAIWPAARNLATLLLTVLITPTYLGLKLLGAIAGWLWENAIGPAFEGIATAAIWLWRYGLKPQFDLAVWVFKLLGETGAWLWNSALKPVFGWIADGAAWLWTNGIKPHFDSIRSGAGYVRDAFVWAKDGIKAAWDQLYEITRKPVQFVVDTVYNNGIRKVWNAVAKITGVGELAEYKFATGGILPGYTPGRDVHLAALSGGEAVMRPEWTRAVGAGYVDTMNAAARSGGVSGVQQALGAPGFADGGIFDRISSGVKTAGSWLSDGVNLLSDPGKAWDKATGFIRDVSADISGSPWASVIAKVPGAMLSGLKDAIVKAAGSIGLGGSSAAPAGGGVSRWTGVVQQALGLTGQPLDYTGITLRRMEQESGGNPGIVNTWDSNWIAGYPSVGLMQVIRPTFQRYAGPFADTGPFLYGVSTNPLANVYASMKYALSAYGSLPRAYNQAGGYDSGGYLQPGMNLAYNGTGRPEPVLTTAQWNALAGSGGKQTAADQRSYQINLNGSQMTAAEQAANVLRHIQYTV
ncbi:transglycosylase SLT domain-containing protein [Streptomyces sp. NBC_01205]|uniref:transglycosylase SLT domain-containing protein n=1 Tax=Streptomyces sp. NBC_01205 TaxID=2903771 RepID=UPI002E115D0A|nr:transglycosylase SLT domain-containing protein [Streptomyces sp. NBC_01205]